MSNQKDIIGIAKELRNGLSPDARYVLTVLCNDAGVRLQDARRSSPQMLSRIDSLNELIVWLSRLQVYLPAVTDALLIAVEALSDCTLIHDADCTIEDRNVCICHVAKAQAALTHIRSLPPQ